MFKTRIKFIKFQRHSYSFCCRGMRVETTACKLEQRYSE